MEGRMLKLKPTLWPPDVENQLIGKDPDSGKDGGRRGGGRQRMRWLDGITDSVDMGLSTETTVLESELVPSLRRLSFLQHDGLENHKELKDNNRLAFLLQGAGFHALELSGSHSVSPCFLGILAG